MVETIEDSLQSDPFKKVEQTNESGSSKFDESWPSTLPSFQEESSPTKEKHQPSVNEKEHSVEDYIERHGTLSKLVSH